VKVAESIEVEHLLGLLRLAEVPRHQTVEASEGGLAVEDPVGRPLLGQVPTPVREVLDGEAAVNALGAEARRVREPLIEQEPERLRRR
jgi:hypothetical protein